MSKQKNNKKHFDYGGENEDYQDISGKGVRKEKRKAKRHQDKRLLDDLIYGEIDNDDYDEFMDFS